MARQVVSLYVDDASIRLLVMRGRDILDWGELQLEPGLVRGSEIAQESQVAEKIRALMRQCRVRSSRVAVGVSGLFCLSRPAILPQLPRNMLDEAVKHEAKRLLPIPPDQCYLTWQVVPGPADRTQIFIVAIPRRIADALYRTLHQAGLKPSLLDIKPLTLARLSSRENAIILDLQEREFDIVVLNGGIPQPIRSVSLPDTALSEKEKLETIRNDLERTIKFYNSNTPSKPLDEKVPLLVSGLLQTNKALREELAKATGLRVLPLECPARSPAAFPTSQYLVNVGLTALQDPAVKESRSAVARLNCLPAEMMPRPISVRRVLVVPAVVVFLAFLALFIVVVQRASANISTVRNELASVNQTIAMRQAVQKSLSDNITKLDKQVTQAEATLKTIDNVRGIIDRKRSGTNDDLVLATCGLPDGVALTGVSYVASTMTVKGSAPDEDTALSYARALTDSGRFARVSVSSVKKVDHTKDPPTFDFVITVLLKG